MFGTANFSGCRVGNGGICLFKSPCLERKAILIFLFFLAGRYRQMTLHQSPRDWFQKWQFVKASARQLTQSFVVYALGFLNHPGKQ